MQNSTKSQPLSWPIFCGLGLTACGFLAAGCSEHHERLNAPPQGHTAYQHESQGHYVPMSDNAMLADMSMSPAHFVPHQSELNGTGMRRLKRYAEIMKIYGGTLHYDGVGENETMVKDRIDRIETYLAAAGLDRSNFSVEPGYAGGAGMNADEAGLIRKSTNFSPDQGGGGEEEGGGGPLAALNKLTAKKK